MKRAQIGNAAWGFRETPLERQLAVTRELGMRRLELSLASTPKDFIQLTAGAAEIERAKGWFAAHGVELAEGSVGNDFGQADAAKNREQVEAMKKKIDIAHRLGIRSLRIFASFAPAKEMEGKRLEGMVAALNAAGAHAKPLGITLAVETHGGVRKMGENRFIHSPSASTEAESVARWLPDCAENITLNFDPANLWAAGVRDVTGFYGRFAKRVSYAHLKDYVVEDRATGTVRPVGCGEGVLDWKPLMAALEAFEGPVFIEYEPTEDVEDGCRRSIRFLETLVG